MDLQVLDEIDRGILHLLQQDARNQTPVDMAEQLPVSDGTVRNRIEKLEEQGIIRGYVPTIDYEEAGFPLQIVFSCTAPVKERSELAVQALEIDGVVNVRELMAPQRNVRVVGIATDIHDINRIAEDLTDLDLTLEQENLMADEHTRPFNHFGVECVEGSVSE